MILILKKLSIILNKKQKGRIAILFFMTLIGAFLEVLGVSLIIPMVTAIMTPDIIKTNKYVKAICNLLDLNSYRTFVIVCIIALIAVFVLKNLFLMVQYYAQARFICNNKFYVNKRMFSNFLKRPYEYFLNANSSEIIRAINLNVYMVFSLLTTLIGLLVEIVVSIALIVTIFVIDPQMMLGMSVLLGILMLAINKIIKPILKKKGEELQIHSTLANKWLLQAIGGIKEIKIANKEEFFKHNYEMSGEKVISAEKWSMVFSNLPRLLIEMVSVCAMLMFIAVMIFLGKEIETLIPALSAFAMAAVKLLPSANRILAANSAIAYNEVALDKLIEDLKEAEQSEDITHQNATEKSIGKIDLQKEIIFSDVVYSYPNSNKAVLDDAKMIIPVGKSIGIVGKSGAGKTTVVDIILGLLKPSKGFVYSDGKDIFEFYKSWISHIGYIPQSIFMLDDTIRANVAFGIDEEQLCDDKVWDALREAQLEGFVKSLPEGLDTQIGERGVRLSGGQRQRIGIARALYENPELLIFDEATSALDNETEAAIMESINRLHGKKTIIIIAHRLQTIESCDIVYRVENGKIYRDR